MKTRQGTEEIEMSDFTRQVTRLPLEQQMIRAKCLHPTGTFTKFKKEEIEQSIPERFEKIVRMYPDRIAIKTQVDALTYDQLNKAANRLARAILARRGGGSEPVAIFLKYGAPVIGAGHKTSRHSRHFFDLGGHSLQATQVISRVIMTFKVEKPIAFLLNSPTVAEMARVISKNQGNVASQEKLARLLSELENLSDEEAQRRLTAESVAGGRTDRHE